MNSRAADVLTDFVSLFFPNFCAGCNSALVKGEEIICSRCLLETPRTKYHLEHENPFYQKLVGRIRVSYVMAFFKFTKGGSVQHILHTLKYRNKPELGRILGRVYGEELYAAGYADKFDLVVPIPLHRLKKIRRGYNQSEEFGNGLSEVLQIPCAGNALERLAMTTTQTRKTRLLRWQNVKEVFAVAEPDAVYGRRVLLVDDVVTTGATLEAAGRVLLKAGCSELGVASIAATQ